MFQRRSSSQSRGLRPAQQGSMERRGSGVPSLFGGDGGPFALLRQLDEDMNRLFDEFAGGRSWGSAAGGGWLPQLEVCERGDGKLHVCADLPGLNKDDIKVDLEDGQLTIQGERHQESGNDEKRPGYFRSERMYGTFYRTIALPEGIDVDTAQATFKDGVLDISFDLPKASPQRGRRLEISGESGMERDSKAWSPGMSGSDMASSERSGPGASGTGASGTGASSSATESSTSGAADSSTSGTVSSTR